MGFSSDRSSISNKSGSNNNKKNGEKEKRQQSFTREQIFSIARKAESIYATIHGYNNYYYNNNRSNIEEQEKEREEEYSMSPKYCEVCRYFKLDYCKYYCYTDNGKNRQIVTICIDCPSSLPLLYPVEGILFSLQ
jgi:hypothetical protein